MPRNLDVAALRSFIAVADSGGVTKAAKRLHLTQSGVSMQLKRLEESLSAELFAREGRGVVLTKTGEELLADARRLVSLNDAIWERMTAPPPEGELTIGMPHDIVFPIAPLVLKRFNADYPGVRLSLISPNTAELLRLFEEGSCDVILTTEQAGVGTGETLSTKPLVWIGAPGGRAWRRRPTPLAFSPNCIFRKVAFDALERSGHGWEWTISTGSDDAIDAAIAADLAISAMMSGSAPAQTEAVSHGEELPQLPMFEINLYTTSGRKAELAEQLAVYVRDAVRQVDELGPAAASIAA